jgi:hypothetical protein
VVVLADRPHEKDRRFCDLAVKLENRVARPPAASLPNFLSQQIEAAHIPSVEMVCACLEGACREQAVINCAAHDSSSRPFGKLRAGARLSAGEGWLRAS